MKIRSIKRTVEGTPGWLKQRFGENVAQISTTTTLKLKSSIKDVFRGLYGYVKPEIEDFCKTLPNPPQGLADEAFVFGYDDDGTHYPGLIETHEGLQEFAIKYTKEWDLVSKTLGLSRSRSRHASAWIIADQPISDFIPLVTIGGYKVTQFTAAGVEAAGGIKMDFLVINVLNDIQGAIKAVQKKERPDIDWDKAYPPKGVILKEVPFIDSETGSIPYLRAVPHNGKIHDIWELPEEYEVCNKICEGDTESVFQFNQAGAVKWLSKFNFVKDRVGGKTIKGLSSIEDLATFTALDRPGTLNAKVAGPDSHNMLEEYANRLMGKPPVGNLPVLDQMFPETKGIPIFQEQVAYLFRTVGKTTGVQAEDFRKHVGKKETKKVQGDKEIFMKGAVESVGPEMAEELWSRMITFSNYGFCKAHAVSYSVTAYACAWLKYHYPLEWWCSVLNNAPRKETDEKFWKHVSSFVLMPDISLSKEGFVNEGDKIRAPLTMLHGVGHKAHRQLLRYAPYKSVKDFLEAIEAHKLAGAVKVVKTDAKGVTKESMRMGSSAINNSTIGALIVSGAMDSLFPSEMEIELNGEKMMVPVELGDRLNMFESIRAEVKGKRKKSEVNLAIKYNLPSPIHQYQVRKSVLPAYHQPLLPLVQQTKSSLFINQGSHYEFMFSPRGDKVYPYILIDGERYQAIESNTLVPINNVRVAFPAYVVSAEPFSYGKVGPKKHAYKMVLDSEGRRMEVVKWGGKEERLPPVFDKDLTGCVIMAMFSKREGKPFFFDGATVVEPTLQPSKEESA